MTEFEIEILRRFKDVDDKLIKLDKDINNHVHTIGIEMGKMNARAVGLEKDIKWLTNLRKEECGKNIPGDKDKESKGDIKTQVDVAWLKKFFWLVIGAIASGIVSIVVGIIMLFVKR